MAIYRCVGGKDQLGQKLRDKKGPAPYKCKRYQLFINNVSVDMTFIMIFFNFFLLLIDNTSICTKL